MLRKRQFFTVLIAFLLAVCSGWALAGTYSGGTGEPDDPYRIATAEDMQAIGANPNDWDKHFILVNDINLAGYIGRQFNIIGNFDIPFTGVFDGNGHSVLNLTYDSIHRDYVGLTGYVDGPNAMIRDLTLIDPNIRAEERYMVGSLAGAVASGSVMCCVVADGNVRGGCDVGGLIGVNGGCVEDCRFEGTVHGDSGVGGLAGASGGGRRIHVRGNSEIRTSFSSGSVTGVGYVGGLVGRMGDRKYGVGEVYDCYSTCQVQGEYGVAGLVGLNGGWIYDSYSIGRVSGHDDVGGLVGGGGYYDTVVNCFWDVQTSEQETSAGGEGKTTEDMMRSSTYWAWGCEGVWTIDDGNDYPRLVWENMPGEPITNPNYGGGSGIEEDPYLIYTPEQLNTIGLVYCHLEGHFRLMEDIDLQGFQFNIIGTPDMPFTGVFDGNGKVIYNFRLSHDEMRAAGMFGYVSGDGALIQNLTLSDSNIAMTSGYNTGALVGSLAYGTIQNCHVIGGRVRGYDDVGGLTGSCYGSEDKPSRIEGCSSACEVEGRWDVGGLCGANSGRIHECGSSSSVTGEDTIGGLVGENGGFDAEITSSFSLGLVTVKGERLYPDAGGFVGWNRLGTISNCYSTGDVQGRANAGGFAGNTDRGVFQQCYATGRLSDDINVGGFVGYIHQDKATFKGCLWNRTVNANLSGAGSMSPDPAGLLGETTENLQHKSTYTLQDWDFINVWAIGENQTYPYLRTVPVGDINHDKRVDFLDLAILASHWLEDNAP